MSIGAFGCWAMKAGDFKAREFDGTSAGLDSALAYCGSNGYISLYPGNASITIPTIAAGVVVDVHEAGLTKRYGRYQEFSRTGKRRNIYNVLDYDDVATAITAVPDGAILYFPPAGGPYIPPDANGWTINKPITIQGDSKGTSEATQFKFYEPSGSGSHYDSTIFKLGASANHVTFRDFGITASADPASLGTGDGIRFAETATIVLLAMENISVLRAGRNGIRIAPGGGNYVVDMALRRVKVTYCKGSGIYLNQVTAGSLSQVYSSVNKLAGLDANSCLSLMMRGLTVESNGDDVTPTGYNGQAQISNCNGFSLIGGHFEDMVASGGMKRGLVVSVCRGGFVAGVLFGGSGVDGETSIYLLDTTQNVTVAGNNHTNVDHNVEIEDNALNTGNIILPQSSISNDATAVGKVIIPVTTRSFAYITDMTSGVANNKGVGVLFPSVATVASIDAAVIQDGLLVYDSTAAALKIRIGGAWKTVTVT